LNADVVFADSTQDAVERLAAAGTEAAPLAGGTWIMRAPLRGDAHPQLYVSLDRIPGLREIALEGDSVRIGAGATHAEIAAALAVEPRLRGLHDAAARSANPAVRAHATLGGASDAPAVTEGKRASVPSAFVCHDHSCAAPVTGYRDLLSLLSPGGDAAPNA